jgi:hypothetical protein
MQWWFVHQPFLLGYILKNVPLLEVSWDKVLEGKHYVCQHLENPIFEDVRRLGLNSHCFQWLWTNLALLSALCVVFFTMSPYFDQKVYDILDPNILIYPCWQWSTK